MFKTRGKYEISRGVNSMRVKLIFVVLILLFFLIIILQNTQPVTLSLLLWTITLPFIVMVISLFIVGFALGIIISSLLSHKEAKNDNLKQKGQ